MKIALKQLRQTPEPQGGFILPVLLITGVAIVLMITAIASEAVTSHTVAAHGNYALQAQLAADAGLDDAMNKMNTVSNWTGTAGQTTLLNDTPTNVKSYRRFNPQDIISYRPRIFANCRDNTQSNSQIRHGHPGSYIRHRADLGVQRCGRLNP
jgi:hypothetical protein